MENPVGYYKEQLKKEMEKNEKAALMGLQLLEQNRTLTDRIDTLTKVHLEELMKSEQEKYSLSLKLEQKCLVEKSQAEDLERAREQLDMQAKEMQRQKDTEKNLHRTISQLTKEKEELKEINQERASELLKSVEEMQVLQLQLNKGRELLENMVLNSYKEEDENMLQATIVNLTNENQKLKHKVIEQNGEIEALKTKNENLKLLNQNANEDIEVKNDQISTYHSLMQTTNEEKEELQVQIEMMKMQELDVDRRGNSLFAEVEDNRHVVQQKLNDLQLQYKSLQEKHDFTSKQMLKLKQQMVTLLSMTTEAADTSYVCKLEQSLSQARNEVSELARKLKEAGTTTETKEVMLPAGTCTCSSRQENNYGYLKSMFEQMRVKKENAEKELQNVRFQKVSESDKLVQCEHKLHAAELAVRKATVENTNLKLKLEEMIRERNGGAVPVKKPVFRVEKIPGFEFPPKKENILSERTNNDVQESAKNKDNRINQHPNVSLSATGNSNLTKKVIISDAVTSIDRSLNEGTIPAGRSVTAPPVIKMETPAQLQCKQQ